MDDYKIPRYWMKIDLSPQSTAARHERNIQLQDAEALGLLYYESYHGTIDDNGETPEQGVAEAKKTLAGEYGDFLGFASFLIEDTAGIQSASMISLYHGKPLLAEIMTRPDAQGAGLAAHLIRRSIDALAAAGYTELYLVVTEGNPAEKLYEKLGFKRIAAAKPKSPPPSP